MADVPRPLPDRVVDLCANDLRILGQPVRIRALDFLDRHGATNVQTIADALDVAQQNLSKHLALLHGAGIVHRQRQGREVWYLVGDRAAFTLVLDAASRVIERAQRLADGLENR